MADPYRPTPERVEIEKRLTGTEEEWKLEFYERAWIREDEMAAKQKEIFKNGFLCGWDMSRQMLGHFVDAEAGYQIYMRGRGEE